MSEQNTTAAVSRGLILTLQTQKDVAGSCLGLDARGHFRLSSYFNSDHVTFVRVTQCHVDGVMTVSGMQIDLSLKLTS